MTNIKNKENKWDLFKQGASSPKVLSLANMYFAAGMFFGAGLASYMLFLSKSWGFAILMFFLSLTQITSIISQRKQYKAIVQMEKDMDENQLNLLDSLRRVK